ncbi:MAG: hypothetical protein HFF26_05970 [Oscillospiraceae bacterium]|nr:hypothetical protein [Oscillospiraceae bacterium]
MKAKTFFITVLAGILLCFGVFILLLSMEDPFFVLHGIDEGETALFDNQRYQMAGLIRHQDYTQVVMGTSLVANYRSSWFTKGTGRETLKITFPDGWISEFDTALQLAFRSHPKLERVYFCLDPNILVRPDSERTVELPSYLYNMNPLDDVEYLLNADTYETALRTWLHRESEQTVTLDEAYVWDGTYSFSWDDALKGYPRPEVRDPLPADALLAAAEENLDVVCRWAQKHPDVQFVIWFPPYSILYWDMMMREGRAEAILSAVEYAAGRLLEYDNISLHSLLYCGPMTNLNYYTDHVHCSGEVTAWAALALMNGEFSWTQEDYRERLDELRQFVMGYDYKILFDRPGQEEQN